MGSNKVQNWVKNSRIESYHRNRGVFQILGMFVEDDSKFVESGEDDRFKDSRIGITSAMWRD